MVGFEFLALYRVASGYLSEEIVILRRVVGIHQRSGRIGFECVLEYAPVRCVAVYDTWCDVHVDGEETAFGGVHH
jgi:hypothetical protein